MKPKYKRAWVKALRSGKFRRARNQLKKNGGYCCLGVLCQINKIDFEPSDGVLPDDFAGLVGLTGHDQEVLANLNDGVYRKDTDEVTLPKGYRSGTGASFNQVADWISKHV